MEPETLTATLVRFLFDSPPGLALLIALAFVAARTLPPALRPPRLFGARDAWLDAERLPARAGRPPQGPSGTVVGRPR